MSCYVVGREVSMLAFKVLWVRLELLVALQGLNVYFR
jgi:hypothetical protein